MRVFFAHHADAFSAEQDPQRRLTDLGHLQADRIGAHIKAAGSEPVRILHSGKQWTRETAERIGAVLGTPGKVELPSYPTAGDSPVGPFVAEVASAAGDIVIAGHFEFLQRSASKLVCGDEAANVIGFKPGNGTVFCVEGSGSDWTVTHGLRQEHLGG